MRYSRTIFLMSSLLVTSLSMSPSSAATARPNILFAISDDQSYPHTSAYGYEAVSTPAFDRVADMGILFTHAFTPAPGCSPMRAAFLTGRHIWQIEHAGTHASSFATKFEGYQDRLEAAGYFVGYTGKGWGPGNWRVSGRTRNPAGREFSDVKMSAPTGIRNTDYAANFAVFLAQRPKDRPFSFWYGASEPHRVFKKGIGRENGLDPAKVAVPSFLPDTPEIRDDLLDYCYEIQWFDQHLARMLGLLEKHGELANTLIIVTSDNGMAFPRAKANVYEYGIHMPLAVAWPEKFPGRRIVHDLVDLIDLTATIYDATGAEPPSRFPLSGRSLVSLLSSDRHGVVDPTRDAIFSGRERHSSSRWNSLGYPQRCIRTRQYLYIRNFRPERWPAGTPRKFGSGRYPEVDEVLRKELGPEHGGYHDIDACPTLSFLIEQEKHSKLGRYLQLSVARRPAEELYDVVADPSCLNNLADQESHAAVREELTQRLVTYLRQTGDPRVVGVDGGDIFETYPRYSKLRWFLTPRWAKENPRRAPRQPWLQERRPRAEQTSQ